MTTQSTTVDRASLDEALRYIRQAAHILDMMANGTFAPDEKELRAAADFYRHKADRIEQDIDKEKKSRGEAR
jgi:hypothetical protein